MYFRLNPECYYIKGKRRSAIYDLIEGNVHSLDPHETQVIQNCETNHTIENKDSFLDELRARCIGNYYNKKVYIEKLRVGSPIQDFQPGQPPFLNSGFLEINNTCNQSCWFCGTHGIHRSMGCMGCNTWAEEGIDLGIVEWKRVIDGLSDLQCQTIFFTGGDITLKWDLIKELLDYAQNKFSRIFAIINSKRFSSSIVDDLDGNATLIIQTEDADEIKKDYQNLLVIDENTELPENIISSNSVIIDRVSKDYSVLPKESPLISKSKITKTDIFRFSHTRKKHPCLANTLTVSWKGEVLPCPLLRSHSLGSVKDRDIHEIFKDNAEGIEKFWTMNLEKIQKCKECEFKYSCNDCRALEETLTGDLYGKKLCNYDVTNGVWV